MGFPATYQPSFNRFSDDPVTGDTLADASRGYLRDWLHFGCTSQGASTPVENAPDLTSRGRSLDLEHETGLAGACRFAAGALR